MHCTLLTSDMHCTLLTSDMHCTRCTHLDRERHQLVSDIIWHQQQVVKGWTGVGWVVGSSSRAMCLQACTITPQMLETLAVIVRLLLQPQWCNYQKHACTTLFLWQMT